MAAFNFDSNNIPVHVEDHSDVPMVQEKSENEKKLREWFVSEYLFDYRPYDACLRMGFEEPHATEYARKFMKDSYVQRTIRRYIEEQEDNSEFESEVQKRQVKAALIREANYHGGDSSHGARVQALGKLVSIFGMDAPKKVESNVNVQGGIMVVPAIASVDNWQQSAVTAQQNLIDDSRSSSAE